MTDLHFQEKGPVWLVQPVTPKGEAWMIDHTSVRALRLFGAIEVERGSAQNIFQWRACRRARRGDRHGLTLVASARRNGTGFSSWAPAWRRRGHIRLLPWRRASGLPT